MRAFQRNVAVKPPDLARQRPAPWVRNTGLAPGLGLAVLAKFSCSFCVAAYAGVLSSLGLGFAATDRGLLTLTVLLVVVGLASVAWSIRRHRSLGPLLLAAVGALVVLAGRVRANPPALYAGTALVAAASVWNFWMDRQSRRTPVNIGARVDPLSLLGTHTDNT